MFFRYISILKFFWCFFGFLGFPIGFPMGVLVGGEGGFALGDIPHLFGT